MDATYQRPSRRVEYGRNRKFGVNQIYTTLLQRRVMSRPKSSIVGFVDLGLTVKNTFTLEKMNTDISDFSAEIMHSNLEIERQLENNQKMLKLLLLQECLRSTKKIDRY